MLKLPHNCTLLTTVRVVNNNGVNAMSVAAGNDVVLKFTFTSVENDIPTGNGTCKILVNGAVKTTFSVENGAANEVNVKDLLIAGTNTVKVTCIDVYGNRWPKCWSFSFSISPSNEYSGLISVRIDWLDLLEVQGTLKSLLQ